MAKKAAAKTASKKTAKKSAKPSAEIKVAPEQRGHILNDPNTPAMLEKAGMIIKELSGRTKNRPVGLKSMAELRQEMLPVSHFYLQYLLGSAGLPGRSMIEFIGDKGVGKTTLALQMCGTIMMQTGAYLVYVGCENKDPNFERTVRCLNSWPPYAQALAERAQYFQAFSFTQMWDKLQEVVETLRGERKAVVGESKKAESVSVPMNIPIIVVIDPWSRLMDPEEEVGNLDWDDNLSPANKAKAKEVGEHGSRASAAKWSQEWCRNTPMWQEQYNMTFLLIQHQSDDMEAAKGAAKNMTKTQRSVYNNTHRGGRATQQASAVQLIMVKAGRAKAGPKRDGPGIGSEIIIRVEKQSFGPSNRTIKVDLVEEFALDGPGFLEPPIQPDKHFADWLAENHYCGVKVTDGYYSSDELGVYGVQASQLSTAFHLNAEAKQRLGHDCRIEGYYDLLSVVSPKAPPPPQEPTATE